MPDRQALERNLIGRVNVGDLLTRSAARSPGQEAVLDGERRFTYGAFNAWVNRIAHGLAALGFVRGDALALMSGNSAEFLATYFACAKLGLVCVPVNLLWRQGELAYVLDHAEACGIVVEAALLGQLAPALEQLPRIERVIVVGESDATLPAHARRLGFEALAAGRTETEPEVIVEDRDAITYLYTSGTTSAPKGVVGNHLAIYLESLGTAVDLGITARDRVTALLPMFHTAQLNALCTPAVAAGATMRVLRGFDAAALLDAIARDRLTVVFALPMMWRAMLQEQVRAPRDVSSLRLALYAMTPIGRTDLEQAIATFGCDFALMFGQTEMSPVATIFRPEHQLSHTGAAGNASVNVQAAIMDVEGRLLPQGETGEIVYRSPQTLTGYLRNPEATEAAFRHGWFHSGDAGHFDADGILWFEDRFKDVIKTGGENVASLEIEVALYSAAPEVQEAAVIGLPHERWGEAITAVVVPRAGETVKEAETLARLREVLSPFKCPKAVIVVEALPKTATGKVQKHELRRRFGAWYGAGG